MRCCCCAGTAAADSISRRRLHLSDHSTLVMPRCEVVSSVAALRVVLVSDKNIYDKMYGYNLIQFDSLGICGVFEHRLHM